MRETREFGAGGAGAISKRAFMLLRPYIKKLIFFDFMSLFFLIVFSIGVQFYQFKRDLNAILLDVRESVLISDAREINYLLFSKVMMYDLISAEIKGYPIIERERRFFESRLFDVAFSESILSNSSDVHSEVGNLVIVNTLSKGILLTFTLWFSVNFILLLGYPGIKRNIEDKIRREEKEIYNERFIQISKQVAHDIRSPLSALDVVLATTEFQSEKKEMLESVSARIKSIANDLLDQSRSDISTITNRNESSKNEQAFEVIPVIEAIVAEAKLSANQIKIEIENRVSSAVVAVGNSLDFGRIISNLLNNSIEAVVGRTEPRIAIFIDETKNGITVTIQDNGCGIPESILHRVGESGFTHGKLNGNGLGISGAKLKLAEWGGSFQLHSKPNEGTIVSLGLVKPAIS